jgi:Bacterial regulatory proteins, luxR family
VFNRLREGHSNKTIARQLEMSEATVKVHVRRIMQKFGVANRTQLAISAINLSAAVNGNASVDEEDDASLPILSVGTKLQRPNGKARVARGEGVMEFLRALLGHGGSVPVIEIERRAHATRVLAVGCSISQDKAFRRARRRLGVVTYQQARRWFWRLPDQTPGSTICARTSTSDAGPL